MTRRILIVPVLLAMGVTAAGAQTTFEAPRLPDGQPDLQGVWDFRSLTPMERPGDLAENEVFTEEQAAAFSADEIGRRSRDSSTSDRAARVAQGDIIPYNDFWFDEGTVVTTQRTSLIVDPADGRIPSLTPAATAAAAAVQRARNGVSSHEPTPGGFVEDLGPGGLQVRCILGFNSGPPMTPSAYNNNVQLFQTEDTVVLLAEMNHNARVVPLTGSDHAPSSVRQWTGDSRGHWDGDTLVVETTNINPQQRLRGAPPPSEHMRVTERFTRVDEETILYEFTVEDPTMYTQAWGGEIPIRKFDAKLYEYACHEGNYSLAGVLSGARYQERMEAQGSSDSRRD